MNLTQGKMQPEFAFLLTKFVPLFAIYSSVAHAADPFASWNEGPAKKSTLEFVAAVTDENGIDYVRLAARKQPDTFGGDWLYKLTVTPVIHNPFVR